MFLENFTATNVRFTVNVYWRKNNEKENRYGLVTAAAVIGLAMPFTIKNVDDPLSRTAIVQAATKRITLKHNAYVYNYRGRRVCRSKLYRNHSYRYYSVRYIHGKKYYRVGKNRYVKAANVRTGHNSSSTNSSSSKNTINTNGMGTPKFQVKIDKDNVDIYSASHSTANGSWITAMPLHGTYNVYTEENGMYEIGKGQWIDENDVDSVIKGSNGNNTTKNDDNVSSSTTNSVSHSTKKSKRRNSDEISGNLTESQKQEVINYFVELINKAREDNGAQPLTLDSSFSAEAQQRAIHDGTTLINTGDEDNHEDENGNSLVPNDAGGEVEAGIMIYPGDNAKKLAQFAYNQFMVNDADQGWAHKKNLLDPNWTTIGVGVYFANGTDNYNFGSLVADLR